MDDTTAFLLPVYVSEHAFRRACSRVDRDTLERWRGGEGGIRAGAAAEVRAGLILDRVSGRAPRWVEYTRHEFVYVLNEASTRCWAVREYHDALLVVTVLLAPPPPPVPPPPPADAYRLRSGMTRRVDPTRPPPRLSC